MKYVKGDKPQTINKISNMIQNDGIQQDNRLQKHEFQSIFDAPANSNGNRIHKKRKKNKIVPEIFRELIFGSYSSRLWVIFIPR